MAEIAAGREPSRALDALVAEKVMGWEPVLHYEKRGTGFWLRPGQGYDHDDDWATDEDVPPYSTSIAEAWEVVEKMATTGNDMSIGHQMEMKTFYGAVSVRFLRNPPRDWMAEKYWDAPNDFSSGRGDTAPHAICLAALIAVGALPTEAASG